jgi:uncharacterized protein
VSVALGLLVGLILGLTGAGGAIIAVPLLIFSMNWDVAQSAPVALVAVACSAALGALIGLRQKIVRYRAALLMAATGAAPAPLGIFAAHRIAAPPLSLLFSITLLIVAWRMYRSSGKVLTAAKDSAQRRAPCQIDSRSGRFVWTAPCTRALVLAGSLTGALSGLLGVGGGFIIVPALRRATDLPMNSIVATSLTVIALVSAITVVLSAWAGHLQLTVALPFAAGSIAGMGIGRIVAPRIAGPKLQQGFALLSALVAVGLMAKTIAGR